MIAGIQVFGSHGSAQVTDQFVSFSLVARGVVAITTANEFGYTANIMLPEQIGSPMVFFGECAGRVSAGIGDHITTLAGIGWGYTVFSDIPVSVDYYVFNLTTQQPSSFGLQVFKADGTLAFDSSSKPMKIVSVTDMSGIGVNLGVVESIALPVVSGRVYACCLSSYRGIELEWNRYIEGIRFSGGVAQVGWTHIYTAVLYANSLRGRLFSPARLVIIDVTNY